MKKNISFIILAFFSIFLISCEGNKVSPNYNKIEFSFPDEYLQYLPYSAPNFDLEYEGNINTVIGATTSNVKFLGKNDDFKVSEIIEKLLLQYQTINRLTVQTLNVEETNETRMNNLVLDKNDNLVQKSRVLTVENNKVYNEIAYISLENGLLLSIDYRRFESIINGDVKTLYAWRYSSPIVIALHYPLIVNVNHANQKELVILPLPPKVIYHLGISSKLDLNDIIEDEKYLNEYYRTFPYPNYNDDPRYQTDFVLEDEIALVKEYYQNYDSVEEDELFYFNYLGKRFSITFLEKAFKIDIIE